MENGLTKYSNQTSLQRLPGISQEQFSNKLAEIKTLVNERALSLELSLEDRQISAYKRSDSDRLGVQIMAWVTDLANAYNLGKNVSADQAAAISKDIIRDYWHLKLAEMAYFFDRAKTGYYGKVYDRIDQAVIYEWLDKHCDERISAIEAKRSTQLETTTYNPEGMDRLLKELRRGRDIAIRLEREKREQLKSDKEQLSREEFEKRKALNDLMVWFPADFARIELILQHRLNHKGIATTIDDLLNWQYVKHLINKKKSSQNIF